MLINPNNQYCLALLLTNSEARPHTGNDKFKITWQCHLSGHLGAAILIGILILLRCLSAGHRRFVIQPLPKEASGGYSLTTAPRN